MPHLLVIWMLKYLKQDVENETSQSPCLLHSNFHSHLHANEQGFLLPWVMAQSINNSRLQKMFRTKLLFTTLSSALYLHPRPATVCFLKQQGWSHVSLGLIPLSGFPLGIIFKVLCCPMSPDLNATFWCSSSFILLSHSLVPESWQEQCPLPQGLGPFLFLVAHMAHFSTPL